MSLPSFLLHCGLGILILSAGLPQLHAADPDGDPLHIYVDFSFKLLKTNTAGPNPGATQTAIDDLCANANKVLDQQQRGWRIRCVERVEINPTLPPASRTFYTGTQILGNGNAFHPNVQVVGMNNWYQWYSQLDANGCAVAPANFSGWANQTTPAAEQAVTIKYADQINDMFTTAVLANPVMFHYRTDVGNAYVIHGSNCGGYGMFPNQNHASTNFFLLSTVGDLSFFLHEMGHYSNLEHTFATKEGTAGVIGDEGTALSDTLQDVWDFGTNSPLLAEVTPAPARWDSLAQRMYGGNYSTLNGPQKLQVRTMASIGDQNFGASYTTDQIEKIWLVWENLMSYHKGADPDSTNWLFSEQQMDRWSDAYALQRPIASGRMWYFGGNGGFIRFGTAQDPYLSIQSANAAASSGGADIIVGRPGSYASPAANGASYTLSKPVTIRATRAGAFSIYGH